MENLKKLLKQNTQIWFFIEDDNNLKCKFLNWAKQNKCNFFGKSINLKKDLCGNFMGIDKNLNLGYVGGHCWFDAKNPPLKINFKKYIGA